MFYLKYVDVVER